MKQRKIPFNDWSVLRIRHGVKTCTSRHIAYIDDPRVDWITPKLEWGFIKKHFWKLEGADSPADLQMVIEMIYRRVVPDTELFFVHFGDFSDEIK